MKYFLILGFCLLSFGAVMAQQTAKELQESARTWLRQGDYEKAVFALDRASKQEPANMEVMRDLAYASHLKRDYSRAIEIGKFLTEKTDTDQKDFQVLGLTYKAIASYKECAKLYKAGLKKFPNSGVIYNEYGELLAMEANLTEAIVQWEKGIEMNPEYSSNYYNAAMYYIRSKNWLRAVLYAELFVNLESYSARTAEIKKELSGAYRNLLAPAPALLNTGTVTPFEKAILATLGKTANAANSALTNENIMGIRTRFILEWVQDKQKQFPYRLFDNQQYLLNEGLFEAYNYWLFSISGDESAYKGWQATHAKETVAFRKLQENRVFRIPEGQYYFTR